mmetsp:Transcript_88149/g.168992  ORF Transcript_88149/g.168992 Transcript_88149/m.168992 type:complete len:255 (-) Transcript_88149:83-847(-)
MSSTSKSSPLEKLCSTVGGAARRPAGGAPMGGPVGAGLGAAGANFAAGRLPATGLESAPLLEPLPGLTGCRAVTFAAGFTAMAFGAGFRGGLSSSLEPPVEDPLGEASRRGWTPRVCTSGDEDDPSETFITLVVACTAAFATIEAFSFSCGESDSAPLLLSPLLSPAEKATTSSAGAAGFTIRGALCRGDSGAGFTIRGALCRGDSTCTAVAIRLGLSPSEELPCAESTIGCTASSSELSSFAESPCKGCGLEN